MLKRLETDVLVIGGGATGTGILRDCALRGIPCILVEQGDLANGATGRNHGLLHSGARYAVKDIESARECIQENKILRSIAHHCVEDTQGLFISLPEDGLEFQQKLITSCQSAGIETHLLSNKQALVIEPNANPALLGAVQVPDGTIDPFRLTSSNILDAIEHGAKLLTRTMVTGLIRQQDQIVGADCFDILKQERFEVYAKQVVNAAGIWGQHLCEYAELDIEMFPAKGSLLILDYRINNVVINRCRPPSDADILVPGDTISLIGTTSEHIPIDQIDNLQVTRKEVDILIEEGCKLAPIMANTRILRAYAGVRPLVSIGGTSGGRDISRGIVLLDHEQRDGLKGFTTITGGKLMTYRLMAEKTTDLLASKLDISSPCITAERPLPGSETTNIAKPSTASIAKPIYESAIHRHGERAAQFLNKTSDDAMLICECEMVTKGEIRYAIEQLHVDSITDLRRRTRLGMGPCQGELCAYRAAGLLNDLGKNDQDPSCLLHNFLEERWKGVKPIFWGDAQREAEFTYWIYEGLMGVSDFTPNSPSEAAPSDDQTNQGGLKDAL